MNTVPIPFIAKILGYAGLVPFLVLALGLWIIPQPYTDQLNQALMTYAAIILSFMGAVHWGAAVDLVNKNQQLQLGLSVIPPLIEWLALLLPIFYGLSLLTVAFVLLCIIDSLSTKLNAMPRWYPKLRVPLTTIVVSCMITALLAALAN